MNKVPFILSSNIKSTSDVLIGLLRSRLYKQKYYTMSQFPLLEKAQITFLSQNKEARLKSPVSSFVQASYSTVLSSADHLLMYHPNLYPPNYNETVHPQPHSEAIEHSKEFLNYNNLFEPWCDYLSQLFLKNQVSQTDDLLQMWDHVSEDYINKLNSEIFQVKDRQKKDSDSLKNESNEQQMASCSQGSQLNGPKKQHQKHKKIGIANFALSQLRTDFIKPKMHLVGLFTGIFYNQGDHWKTFNVLKKQYPTVEQYKQLDTIILSGSSLSVNDQTPEIVDFINTLKEAVVYNPKLKILGICFGHQTLAKMFGGKIVSKKQITGVQRIDFDSKLIHETPYFRRTELEENTFELSEYHKDFVVEVPKDFEVFAQSQKCKIQALISKNKKYLSFQFHPEYSAQYIKGFQMRLQRYHVNDLKSAYSQTKRSSIRHNSSLWQIRKIIRNFIDWEAEAQ